LSYNYIHTTGAVFERGPDKQILQIYVKKYLYSLYNFFSEGSNFGYNTIDNNINKIEKFYNNLYPDEKLIIDSGGYSIITGDIPFRNITKFIECYVYFIEKYHNTFNHILSLDIPIFLNEPKHNTFDNIKRLNYQSCIETKKILDANPELYEKFIFVTHFKIKKQQQIWNEMYNDIWKKSSLKHFSIGGLVSLRGITGIKFSPFIGQAFKIAKMIETNNLESESILHVLGVYHRYDRFVMLFLDKLFNKVYFKNKKESVNITFDTINYTVTALYKIRELPIFDLITDINQLKTFIPNEHLYSIIEKDFNHIKNNENLTNPKLYSLIHVIYEYIIDEIMNKVIDQYDILNLFISHGNNQFRNKLKILLFNINKDYPKVFNKNTCSRILNCFFYISSFHYAYMDGADVDRLDRGVSLFAKDIGFPGDLF